jgi:hypothetical protein
MIVGQQEQSDGTILRNTSDESNNNINDANSTPRQLLGWLLLPSLQNKYPIRNGSRYSINETEQQQQQQHQEQLSPLLESS